MLETIGRNIVGPVMLNYVLWVLKRAQEKKIKVLYFLARDGYLLHRIAMLLCKYYKLEIECRYLYCSRMSLRMATYGYIGKETWELIFAKSKKLTLTVIFDRLQLSKEEKESVIRNANINLSLGQDLTEVEFCDIKQKLISNNYLNDLILLKSAKAFENTISYFRQEQLLSHKQIGIVDSGWTGSMQRSLRQILDRAGTNIKITGFYFGSFYNKHDKADGEYCNWYFDEKHGFWRKVYFCNNVLEAFLSAPHEMTMGYYFTGSLCKPLFKPASDRGKFYLAIEKLDNACMEFVKNAVKDIEYASYDSQIALKKSEKLLKRFMTFPTIGEVEAFDTFMFCDDLSESYSAKLASREQLDLLSNYFILKRFFIKEFRQSVIDKAELLFWPYGTAAFAGKFASFWYRINIISWEALRYFKQSLRS